MIFATEGDLATSAMTMVADQTGEIHLFFPHQPEPSVAYGIDYLHWDGESWLGPYNVIVNADNSNTSHVRAAIDSDQNIHLIWGGGNNRLYYANVPAVDAANALSWSKPVSIGTAVTEAGIGVAPNGTLAVAFSDAETLGTVAVAISDDGGQTWSVPKTVVVTPQGTAPDAVSVAVDGAGRLHLTWTGATLPSGDPFTGVFYARSPDSGLTWSEPLQIDDDRHGEIRAGVVGEDEIHLVWRSNIGGDGTFHQWSADGGDTWSTVNQNDDRGGMSGLPSFAVDSTDRLHYVIGSAFATFWQDGMLAPYVGVAGADLNSGVNQDAGWTSPERAVMTLTLGNRLHVVFETGFNKLWHTERPLDVPEIPPLALPRTDAVPALSAPSEESGVDTAPAPAQSPSEATAERLAIDTPRAQASFGSAEIIFLSIGPVIILLGFAMIMQTRRRSRR